MEYIELNGGACDDCTIAIANDDYTGMSDDTAELVHDAILVIGRNLVIGDEQGFSWTRCAVCLRSEGGNRHQVGYLAEVAA